MFTCFSQKFRSTDKKKVTQLNLYPSTIRSFIKKLKTGTKRGQRDKEVYLAIKWSEKNGKESKKLKNHYRISNIHSNCNEFKNTFRMGIKLNRSEATAVSIWIIVCLDRVVLHFKLKRRIWCQRSNFISTFFKTERYSSASFESSV